jgi:hypothetical protein
MLVAVAFDDGEARIVGPQDQAKADHLGIEVRRGPDVADRNESGGTDDFRCAGHGGSSIAQLRL